MSQALHGITVRTEGGYTCTWTPASAPLTFPVCRLGGGRQVLIERMGEWTAERGDV